jgi:hypothetical protein
MKRRFILYGTFGCHLCDQARALVEPALDRHLAAFEEVDIIGDERLEARYGVRIPVLYEVGNGRELNWPFDAGRLHQFLQSQL